MFTEDLDLFVTDFGVPVVFVGAPAGLLGLKDVADADVLDNQGHAVVVAGQHMVTIRTDAVETLALKAALTVNGVAFKLARKGRVGDGAFSVLALLGG